MTAPRRNFGLAISRYPVATAALALLLASVARAAAPLPQQTPANGTPAPAGSATVTGEAAPSPPAKVNEASKATEFTEVGQAISAPTLKLPDGAEAVRKLSAPISGGKNTVLLNVYKLSGDLFLDVFSSHDNQAWTKLNHIRLKAPLPIRPEKMAVEMRYLQPAHHTGFVVVATDESADLALVFPTGFGGKVSQQVFLTQSPTGARHSYTFGDLDSRGYAIVKESVDSTGEVKPADDEQYFVWNGRTFIPRKQN